MISNNHIIKTTVTNGGAQTKREKV